MLEIRFPRVDGRLEALEARRLSQRGEVLLLELDSRPIPFAALSDGVFVASEDLLHAYAAMTFTAFEVWSVVEEERIGLTIQDEHGFRTEEPEGSLVFEAEPHTIRVKDERGTLAERLGLGWYDAWQRRLGDSLSVYSPADVVIPGYRVEPRVLRPYPLTRPSALSRCAIFPA